MQHGELSKFMTKMIGRHTELPSVLIGWMMIVVHVIVILLLITGKTGIPKNRNMSNYTKKKED